MRILQNIVIALVCIVSGVMAEELVNSVGMKFISIKGGECRYKILRKNVEYRYCAKKIHPVAEKRPNTFGLYDIYGNVTEYVKDATRGGAVGGGFHSQIQTRRYTWKYLSMTVKIKIECMKLLQVTEYMRCLTI